MFLGHDFLGLRSCFMSTSMLLLLLQLRCMNSPDIQMHILSKYCWLETCLSLAMVLLNTQIQFFLLYYVEKFLPPSKSY